MDTRVITKRAIADAVIGAYDDSDAARPPAAAQNLFEIKAEKLVRFAYENPCVPVCRRCERGDHLHDLVHDDRGGGGFVFAECAVRSHENGGDFEA